MNEAIKLAIEKGGYKFSPIIEWYRPIASIYADHCKPLDYPLNSVFSDPLFWQALGKALIDHRRWRRPITVNKGLPDKPVWLFHALRYHELILTGGDTERFWKDLLK